MNNVSNISTLTVVLFFVQFGFILNIVSDSIFKTDESKLILVLLVPSVCNDAPFRAVITFEYEFDRSTQRLTVLIQLKEYN